MTLFLFIDANDIVRNVHCEHDQSSHRKCHAKDLHVGTSTRFDPGDRVFLSSLELRTLVARFGLILTIVCIRFLTEDEAR